MAPARIVYAPRPAKLKGPVPRFAPAVVVPSAPPCSAVPTAAAELVPSGTALDAFAEMLERWHLPSARGWHMLTGRTTRPKHLTEEQARRVQLLLAMEAVLSSILTRVDVGAWMIEPKPGPLLAGKAPVDFLTEVGTPGYVSLLRQVRRWAEM